MRLKLALLLVLPLLLVGFNGPAIAADEEDPTVALPAGTLNAVELFQLFSDRTVESVTAVQGRESTSYYDPNGQVRQLRLGQVRKGRWRVTASSRICLQMEDLPEKCRIVVKEQGTFHKYIVKKNGRHQHTITYSRFLPGNPLGL